MTETVREIRGEPAIVHCSSLAETADGTLLCVWYEGSYETAPDTALRIARRPAATSGGRTGTPADWSAPQTLLALAGVPLGNPVLWRDAGGTLRLLFTALTAESWTEGILLEMRSDTDGLDWSPPSVVTARKGFMPKTRPLVLPGPRVLFPIYHEAEYCPYVMIAEDPDRPHLGAIVGETMARGIAIQPAITQLSDDTLLMLCRSRRGTVWKSLSPNGGYSWSICRPTGIPNPDSAIDLLRAPLSEDVPTGSGNPSLILAGNLSSSSRRALHLAVSEDDGVTWTRRSTVAEGEGEYSYPSAIATADGSVWVSYTEDRYRIRACRLAPDEIPQCRPEDHIRTDATEGSGPAEISGQAGSSA